MLVDENGNPIAQEPVAAEPQVGQGVEGVQQADDGRLAGVEKRIGELTARYHGAIDAAAKKDQQILELTSKMTDLMSRQVDSQRSTEQAIPLPEGMDPAQAAYFESLVGRIEAKYQQQLVSVQAQQFRGEAAGAAAQIATKIGIKDSSWIQERAAQLAEAWKAQGMPLIPKDAARFALAEYLENNPGGQQQGGFAAPTHAALGHSNPPVNLNQNTQRQALPNNFDSLSPQQQEALLQKRGVDDMPF